MWLAASIQTEAIGTVKFAPRPPVVSGRGTRGGRWPAPPDRCWQRPEPRARRVRGYAAAAIKAEAPSRYLGRRGCAHRRDIAGGGADVPRRGRHSWCHCRNGRRRRYSPPSRASRPWPRVPVLARRRSDTAGLLGGLCVLHGLGRCGLHGFRLGLLLDRLLFGLWQQGHLGGRGGGVSSGFAVAMSGAGVSTIATAGFCSACASSGGAAAISDFGSSGFASWAFGRSVFCSGTVSSRATSTVCGCAVALSSALSASVASVSGAAADSPAARLASARHRPVPSRRPRTRPRSLPPRCSRAAPARVQNAMNSPACSASDAAGECRKPQSARASGLRRLAGAATRTAISTAGAVRAFPRGRMNGTTLPRSAAGVIGRRRTRRARGHDRVEKVFDAAIFAAQRE